MYEDYLFALDSVSEDEANERLEKIKNLTIYDLVEDFKGYVNSIDPEEIEDEKIKSTINQFKRAFKNSMFGKSIVVEKIAKDLIVKLEKEKRGNFIFDIKKKENSNYFKKSYHQKLNDVSILFCWMVSILPVPLSR